MKVDWKLPLLFLFAMSQTRESEQLRGKRQALYPPPLVYPFSGTFKLVVGLAVPVELSGKILVYGQNFQFQYTLPDNATFFTNFFEGSSRRRRRSVSWNERAPVYDVLEQELDRRNIDGKSCLKKNICEAAATPVKDEGLVGELLHLLLTPDRGDALTMDREYLEAAAAGRRQENCTNLYSSCPEGREYLHRKLYRVSVRQVREDILARLPTSMLIMRLLFWAVVCVTFITVGKLAAAGRPTRSLTFRKGSSYFYRVNYKLTSFSYTTIFAYAAGFKLVWQLPSGPLRIRRSISDVHEAAELVYESHGFDGRSCLLKNVCQAMEYVRHRDGVIAKILKLLVGSYGDNGTRDDVYCDVHVKNCPLELVGIDAFVEQ